MRDQGANFVPNLERSCPSALRVHCYAAPIQTPPGTKAWGNPAIVARCGVAEPAAYSATSQLLEVDGVTWYPEELQAGVRFTSLQTPELVEVSIPNAYELTADILTELSLDISSLTP